MVVSHVYLSCSVVFVGFQTLVDLVTLYMLDFYVILGMAWLSPYHDVLNYILR